MSTQSKWLSNPPLPAGLCCCKISWDIFGIKNKCAKLLGPCRCAFAITLFVWSGLI
jgi:hypothetical protein